MRLHLSEASPTNILVRIFRVRSLIALKPEAIPVEISLQGRETRPGMVGLVHLMRIKVELDRSLEPVEVDE
jgi:hypothetical protein